MVRSRSRSQKSRRSKSSSNRNRNRRAQVAHTSDQVGGITQTTVDPPRLVVNIPTITFVHYRDVTEVYINHTLQRTRETTVAYEQKVLARQLEALGAVRVEERDMRDLDNLQPTD